jgi:hypothetical protein
MSEVKIQSGIPWKRGVQWYQEGWELFMKAPVKLGLLAFSITACSWLITHFSLLGILVNFILSWVIQSGYPRLLKKLDEEGEFDLSTLTTTFKSDPKKCIMTSVFMILPMFTGIVAVIGLAFAHGLAHVAKFIFHRISSGDSSADSELWNVVSQLFQPQFLLLAALIFLVSALVSICYQTYGFILVANHGAKPLQALGYSVKACFSNAAALTVNGLVFVICAFLCLLTLGLGLVILMPFTQVMLYKSSLDLFGSNDPSQSHVQPVVQL